MTTLGAGMEFILNGRIHIVTSVTPKSIKYDTAVPGWEMRQHHTTTPQAFNAVMAAGLITLIPTD